jgi:uncharacterized protein YggE
MSTKAVLLSGALALCASLAHAQAPDDRQPVIVVVGHGEVSKAPDIARFSYNVRGEGKTSVDALAALTAARGQIEAGLTRLVGASETSIDASELSVSEARGANCKGADDDNTSRLSTGNCAVAGYIATLKCTVTMAPVDKIGNAISLAAQLGAINPTIGESDVLDAAALQGAANKSAVEDAQRQAELVAAAAHMHLGPLIRVVDSEANNRDAVAANDRPAPPAVELQLRVSPQVAVDLEPQPVSRSAAFFVTYGLRP